MADGIVSALQVPMAGLAALAAGLSQDSGIRLRLGESWRFDPQSRVIEVDKAQFAAAMPPAAGLLAHEVGHVWISRYHHFEPAGLAPAVWGQLMNMLEDPRVNGWMRRRLPGTEPWFQLMFAADRETPVTTPSRFQRWGAAVSVADAYGWREAPAWIADHPSVLEAYEKSIEARRRYAAEVPPPNLAGAGPDAILGDDMAARLRDDPQPRRCDAVEAEILRSAGRAIAIAEREVMPLVRSLIEEDVQAIAGFLAEQPLLAEKLEEALSEDVETALEVIAQALAAPPKVPPEGDGGLARRALGWFLQRRERELGLVRLSGAQGALGTGRSRRLLRSRAGTLDPTDLSAAVRCQLPRLLRDLEAVLAPWNRRCFRSGFATGQRIDLRRAMRFEADRRGHDKLWQRRIRPDGPRTAVSLLVDLSGSMDGTKIAAATAGTLLLAETLERLRPAVRFAINGFQDELIPILAFGEPLSPAAQTRLIEMPDEVNGVRTGGHNCPRWNDDAPCLEEAARALCREAGQRILIVVSDGLPSGRRSTDQDLRDVIARLSGRGAGLSLFGLGLGPGTDHVGDYYPNAVANIPVDRFADEIGRLLKRVLLAPAWGHR